MPQGPNKNDVSKTSTGVVFSNPGNTPSNPLAGVPVVVVTAGTQKSVQGTIAGTSTIISNPA